jgi:pantetheine-phosphate adenylyltransferase
MKKTLAVYPGTFDPLTNGHVDIVKRALKIFDKVVLAIAFNSKKQAFFTVEERMQLISQVLGAELNLEITSFQGLTSDYCKEKGATAIIRGLRAVADFDYEYAISLLNKKLAPQIETVFFMASGENSFISSSMVKEVARYGKTVENYVPEVINEALLKKFKEIQK